MATYNVGCSLLTPAILAWAKGAAVDVLLLQEVENESENPEYIEHVAFEHGYYAMYALSRIIGKTRTHGLAVLSKFPIRSSQVLELPRFNLRFHSRRRIAMLTELQTPQGELRVCNLHLDSRLNIQERIQQLDTVLVHVATRLRVKVVLGGDFNTIPLALWKNVIPFKYVNQQARLQKYLSGHGFSTSVHRKMYSFRPRTVRWLLDGVYVRDLAIQDYGVELDLPLSDHIPLWVDVA